MLGQISTLQALEGKQVSVDIVQYSRIVICSSFSTSSSNISVLFLSAFHMALERKIETDYFPLRAIAAQNPASSPIYWPDRAETDSVLSAFPDNFFKISAK